MNHEEAQALLEACLDEQLGVADTARLEAHLAGCDSCRAWLHERRALRARLQAAPLRYRMPADVAGSLEALAEQSPAAPAQDASVRAAPAQPARPRRPLLAATWPRALAASLLAGLLGLWAGPRLPLRHGADEPWVGAYVRSNLSSHPLDVLSSDHHTVKPWLSARLPYSPPVPEMAGPDDELLGARVDYIGRRAIAALVYRHGKHQVDVFVWPVGEQPDPAAAGAPIAGFHVENARAQDFNAVFVSDLAAPELAAFRARWGALTATK